MGEGSDAAGIPAASLNDPSAAIAAALRSQLGLNLDGGKGPVEVYVIERAEKPSGN